MPNKAETFSHKLHEFIIIKHPPNDKIIGSAASYKINDTGIIAELYYCHYFRNYENHN